MSYELRAYVTLALVAFALHLMWERFHIALYTGYEALEGILPVFVAAAVGDVMYTLLTVLGVALWRWDAGWILNAQRRDFALLALLGFFIALFVEYKAAVLGRWEYTDMMPLVPLLDVGVSPLAQMTVLLPLSVYITMRIYHYFFRYS